MELLQEQNKKLQKHNELQASKVYDNRVARFQYTQ